MDTRRKGQLNKENATFPIDGGRFGGWDKHGVCAGQTLSPIYQSFKTTNVVYIAGYLGAIVAANLLVVQFGPAVTVINAFVFIGLDLTSRDALHDAWRGKNLKRNMALLIAVGSILSWMLNRDAGQIALASFVAFALAGMSDTVVYSVLGNRRRIVRINGSNLISAAVDSIVFPTLAFWSMMPAVVVGQFIAKVAGGFVWSLLLGEIDNR